MAYRFTRKFFNRPALEVCRDILGKFLVHKIGKKKIIGKIVEVEAYVGSKDRASHALGGKITERNRAEFLEGGHVYIYLVYGMYWQFNISTGKKGIPECFLIRALEPIEQRNKETEKQRNLANGPGKLCRWMGLNKKHYGLNLANSQELWVEDRGERVPNSQIVRAKRIGIDYAGKYWASKPWRFYIRDNAYISRV